MTTTCTRILPNVYFDSVMLLAAARRMREGEGVTWATAVMATPANLEALRTEGFPASNLTGASASDLVLAVRAEEEAAAERALDAGEQSLSAPPSPRDQEPRSQRPSRTLEQALFRLPSANLAVISVPGEYAALEAHKALTAGLHVLLFSDNVPLSEEVELKKRAGRRGVIVMGPGAGTAVLGGAGLGFANVVRRGRVGVVAAAGTGAQEVMTLLDRWGAGVSQVIGVGGRDLSPEVGGLMAAPAVRALSNDPDTDVILLVSKPPAAAVARNVMAQARGKPLVAALIGITAWDDRLTGAQFAVTLEQGAMLALAAQGASAPGLAPGSRQQAEAAIGRLRPERTLVHGYFSGGTLCSEAQVILARHLGPVFSNIPLDRRFGPPAPADSHICLDVGEEEFTKGRPHPMIDPAARIEILRESARDPRIAVILIDVVLGHGAHPDPAGELAPVCAEIAADGGPQVVAYLLGTETDPQDYRAQRHKLERAGCLVPPTNARAAHLAAAIAARQPALAGTTP